MCCALPFVVVVVVAAVAGISALATAEEGMPGIMEGGREKGREGERELGFLYTLEKKVTHTHTHTPHHTMKRTKYI